MFYTLPIQDYKMQAINLNSSQAEKKQKYLKKCSTCYKIYYIINEIKYQISKVQQSIKNFNN